MDGATTQIESWYGLILAWHESFSPLDFGLIAKYLPLLLQGLWVTVKIVLLSVSMGFCLAWAVALLRLSPHPLAHWPMRAYIFTFRGTPLLVQLSFLYYGVGQLMADSWIQQTWLWPYLREPFWYAVLGLTLNTGAYGGEIVRGAIQSVPYGQIEAARAYGMSGFTAFRRIIAPQALRQVLPAYGNEMILMVKASSLASLVAVSELSAQMNVMRARTYHLYEAVLTTGAIYLLLNGLIAWGVARLERALRH
jgi:octopine/nopaline transport system permease protein